jgi:hypothetical protein
VSHDPARSGVRALPSSGDFDDAEELARAAIGESGHDCGGGCGNERIYRAGPVAEIGGPLKFLKLIGLGVELQVRRRHGGDLQIRILVCRDGAKQPLGYV